MSRKRAAATTAAPALPPPRPVPADPRQRPGRRAYTPGAVATCPVTGQPDPRPAWATCTDQAWFEYVERSCGDADCEGSGLVKAMCASCRTVEQLLDDYVHGRIGDDPAPDVDAAPAGGAVWKFVQPVITFRWADMTLALRTDFIDYYDAWFESERLRPTAPVWVRQAAPPAGLAKVDQFMELAVGFRLPIVPVAHTDQDRQELERWRGQEVVVYLDEYLHAGNGKERVSIAEALALHPGRLMSRFVRTAHDDRVLSTKWVQVGPHRFDLVVAGRGDWRTNRAPEVEVQVMDYAFTGHHPFAPLFAIDFVSRLGGVPLAVDLNLAPGLRNTGIPALLGGPEAAAAIMHWFGCHPRRDLTRPWRFLDQPERYPAPTLDKVRWLQRNALSPGER